MTKQQAQDAWDDIVTVPDLDRSGAERILAEQQWFSLHFARSAGLQLGWFQRCAGRVRLGLAVFHHRDLPGVADAGT